MTNFFKNKDFPVPKCSILVRACNTTQIEEIENKYEVTKSTFNLGKHTYFSVYLLNYYSGESINEKLLNLLIRKTHGPHKFGIKRSHFFVIMKFENLTNKQDFEKILFHPEKGCDEDEEHVGMFYGQKEERIAITLSKIVNKHKDTSIVPAKIIYELYDALAKEFNSEELVKRGSYENINCDDCSCFMKNYLRSK